MFRNRFLLTAICLILAGALVAATFFLTQRYEVRRFASAVADQQTLAAVTKILTPDYTHPNYTDYVDTSLNHAESNMLSFGDSVELVLHYPEGFLADSSPILFPTITLEPAVGGGYAADSDASQPWNSYMAVVPQLNPNHLTADGYLKQLRESYTAGPQPGQKSIYSTFPMHYDQPFRDGYTSKKLGDYTCYYFNEEDTVPGYRWCHVFGHDHLIDIMYRTSVAASELGPLTPAFTTQDAETIIAAIELSGLDLPNSKF